MSSVPEAPPVRHGRCRLIIIIDDVHYLIRRARAIRRGVKVWNLKSQDGPRAGAVYAVIASHGQVGCTCPDATRQNAVCKHVRALQAARLVNPRLITSEQYAAATLAGKRGA